MPKSDTWPGGAGLETLSGMDSGGSCDSVVSANSGFSDDSLEHLSAEEKACLMFLEETIESLDTEEDSGLSNDEADQVPSPGSLSTKPLEPSASMSKSKLTDLQNNVDSPDTTLLHSYLVPTPFALAGCSIRSVSCSKREADPDMNPSKPPITNNKPHQINPKPSVHFAVNVVVPPQTKPKEYPGQLKTTDGRGPLSYEALVYLRRSASTKKTPLCPTVDHTLESEKDLPTLVKPQSLAPKPDSSQQESSKPRTSPPAVPPKPKKVPADIAAKTQNGNPVTTDASLSLKHAKDPQVVRLEALQKLGLLKEEESENERVAPLPPPKSSSFLDPTHKRLTKASSNPQRNPSFSYSQVPKNKPLQSSASFHHHSRSNQPSVLTPDPFNGVKPDVLDGQRSGEHFPEAEKPASVPKKQSQSVGYTVMVVPGMGADRREALRKLGLLKQ